MEMQRREQRLQWFRRARSKTLEISERGRRTPATFSVPLRHIAIMRKFIKSSCIVSICVAMVSCGFPGGSINIRHSQYDHYYEMTAKFNPGNTTKVDRYLDQELSSGDMTFANTEMDGEITLDNKTTFYIKKSPGYLNIKLDKEKNSEEAFTKLKGVLEGIGEVVR